MQKSDSDTPCLVEDLLLQCVDPEVKRALTTKQSMEDLIQKIFSCKFIPE